MQILSILSYASLIYLFVCGIIFNFITFFVLVVCFMEVLGDLRNN